MAWVYILGCADGTLDVGSTIDLGRRLLQHEIGQGAAHTRRPGRLPVTLRWSQAFDRVDDAFRREKQIQGWSRVKRLALIEGRLDDLGTLSRGRTGWHIPGDGDEPASGV